LMQLGKHLLRNSLLVAPMAGVTDRPFRQLCRRFGAGLAVSEMVSSRPELRSTRKSLMRTDHEGECAPVSVQIVGSDPAMMADAARFNADHGAEIIDINLGCPAKKVCNVAAGSALLGNELLVASIFRAVVAAVNVPVTVKIRTGTDTLHRNAVRIARMAEDSGIQMIAVHGRTRACGFAGQAEYGTISAVKAQVSIPVIANGDIRSPEDARRVLDETRADGLMIGRAAQGRPWIFREILHFLESGEIARPPLVAEIEAVMLEHLNALHMFYGPDQGVRIARKHTGWYVRELAGGEGFRAEFNRIDSHREQLSAARLFFARLADDGERLVYASSRHRPESGLPQWERIAA